MAIADAAPRLAGAEEALAAARAYAAEIAPGAVLRDAEGGVPRAELDAFDASGLAAITVPRDYGGAGLGPAVLAEVTREISAADPALGQLPQAHWLMIDVLRVWGSEPLREKLFGCVVGGARLGNALAERGGVHAQDLKTTLIDGRLNGRKGYSTGALTSAWIGVSALNGDGRLTLAFVPRDADGVTLDEEWDVIGQRATVSGGAVFEDVAIDPEWVIDYAHAYEVPQQLGARAQLVHAAVEVGIAGGALRDARAYLREKARPATEAVRGYEATAPADDPHVLHGFGRLSAQVAAAEALLQAAGESLERIGLEPVDAAAAARGSLDVAAAKAFGSEVAVQTASELFALTGASATASKYGLDRHWRNARTHSVHDPVSWKYHHIGAYELADVLPPNHGQL